MYVPVTPDTASHMHINHMGRASRAHDHWCWVNWSACTSMPRSLMLSQHPRADAIHFMNSIQVYMHVPSQAWLIGWPRFVVAEPIWNHHSCAGSNCWCTTSSKMQNFTRESISHFRSPASLSRPSRFCVVCLASWPQWCEEFESLLLILKASDHKSVQYYDHLRYIYALLCKTSLKPDRCHMHGADDLPNSS